MVVSNIETKSTEKPLNLDHEPYWIVAPAKKIASMQDLMCTMAVAEYSCPEPFYFLIVAKASQLCNAHA